MEQPAIISEKVGPIFNMKGCASLYVNRQKPYPITVVDASLSEDGSTMTSELNRTQLLKQRHAKAQDVFAIAYEGREYQVNGFSSKNRTLTFFVQQAHGIIPPIENLTVIRRAN